MSYSTKNKLLMALLLLLLLANIVTICVFWLGKPPHPTMAREQPSAYIIRELSFDDKQKTTYLQLVKQHQQQAEDLRQQVKTAKDNFFKLLQQPNLSDSEKINAAKNISLITTQLDLITFDHFKKVRALCNAAQQKKFDNIIGNVMHLIGGPANHEPGMRPGPLPGDREAPPPGREGGPPPPPR